MKTLVIGGTGKVGSAVVSRLAARGESVRVLSRTGGKGSLPGGVGDVVGDLADPGSLGPEMLYVDAIFLLAPVHPDETLLGLNGVEAAKAAKVGKLVYLSVFGAEAAPAVPHFIGKLPVEEAVKDSGLPWTILRPNYFFQNDEQLIPAIAQGVYPQPLGQIGVSGIDVGDIADAAVNALTGSSLEGQTIPLAGGDVMTGPSVASTYARHLGREVRYGGDDLAAWSEQMAVHLPSWLVLDLRAMFEHFQRHGLRASAADLEATRRALGREPRRFDDFAAALADRIKAGPAPARG